MRTSARFLVALFAFAASPASASRTVAIAYFDNNSGSAELDPLRKGLADMLITDLSNVSSIQIVERAKLNEVLAELKLGQGKFIDPKTAQKLGKGLAAEFIMTGGYAIVGDTLRIDARIIQVSSGKVAAGEKVEGKRAEFFALEKELVDTLVKALDLKLSFAEKGKLRSNATESFDAWSKYAAGLDASDKGDSDRARQLFQAALDADPNYKAARTATDRLNVIFNRTDTANAAAYDAMRRSLDPKAPDFGKKVNDLLQQLDSTDGAQLGKKVALLQLLADRDAAPATPSSRVPLEVLGLLSRFFDDPDEWQRIPVVCEYLITRFPKDPQPQPQCKVYLNVVAAMSKMPLAIARKNREEALAHPHLDFEVALAQNNKVIKALFATYAERMKRK